MAELQHWTTGMITVNERSADGVYPVTLTSESGAEVWVHVKGFEDVEALAETLNCTWALLYRGRSWIQLHD